MFANWTFDKLPAISYRFSRQCYAPGDVSLV